MGLLEERARESLKLNRDVSFLAFNKERKPMVEWEFGYCQGASEQRKTDHSKEHVIWLIKQYKDWEYEKGHDMNAKSWEEWVSKALKDHESE